MGLGEEASSVLVVAIDVIKGVSDNATSAGATSQDNHDNDRVGVGDADALDNVILELGVGDHVGEVVRLRDGVGRGLSVTLWRLVRLGPRVLETERMSCVCRVGVLAILADGVLVIDALGLFDGVALSLAVQYDGHVNACTHADK